MCISVCKVLIKFSPRHLALKHPTQWSWKHCQTSASRPDKVQRRPWSFWEGELPEPLFFCFHYQCIQLQVWEFVLGSMVWLQEFIYVLFRYYKLLNGNKSCSSLSLPLFHLWLEQHLTLFGHLLHCFIVWVQFTYWLRYIFSFIPPPP